MKLLAIILVCSQLYLNGAHSEMLPTFCDDGLVEAAVDEAIKTYNKKLVSGNQFARYQITEAKKSETTFKIKYHVRESNCPVGGDKIWLDCDYLPEGKAEMRPCTTEVKHSGKTNKVVSVTCHSLDEERIAAERMPCLGCPREIPTNNTELAKALQHALKTFNNESKFPNLFIISVIKKATIQVVAGWKYNAHFEMYQSNCSKAEFEEITPECQPENSVFGNCNATIYVVPWKREIHPDVNCETKEIPSVFIRMPPGMSPFSAIVENVDNPKTPEEASKLRRDGDGEQEGGKQSSDKSKEHVTQSPDSVPTDSEHAGGEESQEQATGSGPVTPDPNGPIGSGPGPVIINPDVMGEPDRLLDLPGGPGPVDLHHLFHCPSKPWKSIDFHVVTHAPQPKSVTDGPPTVVTEDKLKQSGTFTDADLLAGL
ncbi:kininogen-1-like [Polyodon spathula]|uniref:kininogen-1-like n=1 Tax=Polyodon spathula TaxID=7913 RepID=UPI001B7E83CF|nr:kininogen-1-like [Polyodon spathula]